MDESSRRSLDNFYGYGLSNEWHYFMFTFDLKVDRDNDDIVKDVWSKWQSEG